MIAKVTEMECIVFMKVVIAVMMLVLVSTGNFLPLTAVVLFGRHSSHPTQGCYSTVHHHCRHTVGIYMLYFDYFIDLKCMHVTTFMFLVVESSTTVPIVLWVVGVKLRLQSIDGWADK